MPASSLLSAICMDLHSFDSKIQIMISASDGGSKINFCHVIAYLFNWS